MTARAMRGLLRSRRHQQQLLLPTRPLRQCPQTRCLSALEVVATGAAGEVAEVAVGVDEVHSLRALARFGDDLQEDATAPAVWTSDDPSVAAVSNVRAGRVVGRTAAHTTLRATYLGQRASLPLTVSPSAYRARAHTAH